MPHVHTGYPSGMVPGARPCLLLPDPDGRNNSVAHRPRHYVRNPKGFRFYVRSTDHLHSADLQVAPSGVIGPLRTSPEILPGLLAYVSCILELPPQVGVLGGVPLSTLAATPSGGGVLLGTGVPDS
jgi:hypothetical protein